MFRHKYEQSKSGTLARLSLFLISVLLACTLTGLVVYKMTTHTIAVRRTVCQNNLIKRTEYMNAPLTPFSELTKTEVDTISRYFSNHHPSFRTTHVDKAKLGDNFIHFMEAQIPPKTDVIRFLDNGGTMPERKARVVIFRGNSTPPVVEEYELPLSKPYQTRLASNKSRKTSIPHNLRPFSRVEFRAAFSSLIPLVSQTLDSLIRESYGAKLGPKCGSRCVRLSMTPISSAFLPKGMRAAWFWLAYDREFYTLHPLDLQFLVNTTDIDCKKWTVNSVFYANQFYRDLEELARLYNEKSINVTRTNYPNQPESELYSSLHMKGDPFPSDGKPPPVSTLYQGIRFNVVGNKVEYLRWKFFLRVSPSIGLQLFDIQFAGERIAYEISLQEIAVLYTGYTPASNTQFFADSAGLFGTRMRGMLEGEDCPPHAVYLDTRLFASNDGGLKRFRRAFCLFEHNSESALRRHRAYSISGAFYSALTDTFLVLRTYITLINYDYIIDYSFHANGAIHVDISSTGYLAASFYLPMADRFGTRIREHTIAELHLHLFHIKVDLDIAGRNNSFSTFDVNLENKNMTEAPDFDENSTDQSSTRWLSPDSKRYYMMEDVKRHESDACYKFNFSTPKYLLVSGGKRSALGHRPAYRVLPRGMAPVLLPADNGFEPSVSWARCQVTNTLQKDSEATSSSIFAMWDAKDPTVNFTTYHADNDMIEEKVRYTSTQ